MNCSFPVKNVTPSGTYHFLGHSTPLRATDLMRKLSVNQHSDIVDYDELTHANWHLVGEGMSGWVGSTLNDFRSFIGAPTFVEVIRKGLGS